MAAHLTEKENYLRMIKGEVPEYVPRTMGFRFTVTPAPFDTTPAPGVLEYKDLYGVPMVVELNSGPIPKPGVFILPDIRKWRDVIKRPKVLDEIDWEACAKKELEKRDPELIKYGMATIGNGYFMILTYFMGFDNALVAIIEEPEEVKALFNFILDINLEYSKKLVQYYKIDVIHLGDDIAHERAPFVSDETFMDIFEPMWRKNIAPFVEAGIPCEHHNCGAFEAFVPHMVNMGFSAWNPAQPKYNDLTGIKAKYGRKLGICGGYESNGMVSWPETTEEQIRAYSREVLDKLAPGGGYAFGGSILGAPDNPIVKQRNAWILEEYEKKKFDYYK